MHPPVASPISQCSINIYTYIHISIYRSIYLSIYLSISISIYIYTCMYTYMYISIHIYRYIQGIKHRPVASPISQCSINHRLCTCVLVPRVTRLDETPLSLG